MREPRPTAAARILPAALLLLALAAAVPLHAVTVREVPSPRPVGWSVDLTGRVPKATLAEIDRLGNEVKAKNGDELAVVVVGTTSGVPTHAFATDLFNTWHIGRDLAKGVLVFVALDDRQIEIVVGRGLASSPSLQEATAAILNRDMVPLLRQGDPGGAALAGARSSARDLLGVTPGPAAATTTSTAPAAEPATPAAPAGAATGSRAALAVLALAVLGVLGWLGYRFTQRRGSK